MSTFLTVLIAIWISLFIGIIFLVVVSLSISSDTKSKFANWWSKHISKTLDPNDSSF